MRETSECFYASFHDLERNHSHQCGRWKRVIGVGMLVLVRVTMVTRAQSGRFGLTMRRPTPSSRKQLSDRKTPKYRSFYYVHTPNMLAAIQSGPFHLHNSPSLTLPRFAASSIHLLCLKSSRSFRRTCPSLAVVPVTKLLSIRCLRIYIFGSFCLLSLIAQRDVYSVGDLISGSN